MRKTTHILTIILLCLSYWANSQQTEVQKLIQSAYEEQKNDGSAGQVLARWLRVYNAIPDGEKEYRSEACMSIANIYSKEQLHKQALPYYLEALPILENQTDNLNEPENLYRELGQTYAELAKPDSSYYFYNKILSSHKKENNFIGQINALQRIVDAYYINKDFQKSLEYNLQLKELLENNKGQEKDLMRIYNNLGYNHNHLQQYEDAISYFKKALEYRKKNDPAAKVILSVNIGIAYYNLDEFNESIKYLQEAKKIKGDFDPKGIDEIDHLIATVYLRKKDHYNALLYSQESVDRAKKNKHFLLLSDIYYTSALIHSDLYEYDVALDFFQKHLSLRDSFALEEKIRQQELLQQQLDLERTEKQIKLFMINEDVQKLTIAQLQVEKENQELALKNQEAELIARQKEKEILQKENEIKASKIQTQELETQRAKQELELARQRLIASQNEQEVANLLKTEAEQKLKLKENEVLLASEKSQKDSLRKDKEFADLALEKQNLALAEQNKRIQLYYGLGALMALLLVIAGAAWINSRRLNQELNKKNVAIEQQKEEISTERNKSDQLLLNILPEETALELKEKGFAIPKSYDEATVLFTDFSGFTQIASKMSPEQLIQELNYCFQAFDAIIMKYGLEKIKTIGDAYMCVSGIPLPDKAHSLRAVQAGKEIVEFMDKRIAEKNRAKQEYWQMRMGIHSGPVVAGVVGKKKFAYDIWGDTVNIASRMESNGVDGKINISEATYQLVKKEFNCIPRGKILAKNLGEVNMYFVE